MSIKVQLVTALIPDSLSSVAVSSFDPVSDLSRAFCLPLGTNQHSGLGSIGGPTQGRSYFVIADLDAVGQITFSRGGTIGDCIVGCWLIEFTGQPGDVDEFRVEKKMMTFASSAVTVDSDPLTTIQNPSKVVPILHVRHSNNSSSNVGAIMCGVEMATSGSDNINHITRLTSSGTPTCLVYNVEWVHSAVNVQSGAIVDGHDPRDTDVDTTIASVGDRANAFVYSILKNQNDPDDTTYYAWLADEVTLRTRVRNTGALQDTVYWWVVSGPIFNVQHISAVDSTLDWIGGDGSTSQTEHISIDPVDQTRACIIGHAGSEANSNTDHPAALWGFLFSADDEIEATRVKNLGDSQYAVMAIEFEEPPPVVELPPAMRRHQNTLLRM